MTYLQADNIDPIPAGERFRNLVERPEILQLPGAHNGLSALQAKAAGFEGLYLSGAAMSASMGLPDLGILTIDDICFHIRQIARVSQLPVLVDGDHAISSPRGSAFSPRSRAVPMSRPSASTPLNADPRVVALETTKITRYRTIDVDALKLFYREAGASEAPALLLLHGFPTSSIARSLRNPFPRRHSTRLTEKHEDPTDLCYDARSVITPLARTVDYGLESAAPHPSEQTLGNRAV